MKKILSKLTLLSATQLTIISFLLASLLGGCALYISEHGREVIVDKPILRTVRVIPANSSEGFTNAALIEEEHVYIDKEIKNGISFTDALFTSVSALCVTGLTTTDFSQFTPEGQVIVMVLIQMGGLGIIVFTTILAFAVFRGISEKSSLKNLLSSVMDASHHDVFDMLKYVVLYTFTFEFIGFLIMGSYLDFGNKEYLIDNKNPWWWALFHSISAFNNAGFGLLQNNLANFPADYVINSVISTLIVLGGLGYPVLIFIYYKFRKQISKFIKISNKNIEREISGVASLVQVRIAIIGSVILLIAGTIATLAFEYNNSVLKDYPLDKKILISYFHSVSTRTAGFNTVDIGAFHISTLFIFIILMFVGANPAGTAGGIKIPTIAVLYGYIKDWFKEPGKPVALLGRDISKFAVSHAVRLFFFSVILIVNVTLLISIIESKYLITPDPIFNFQKVLFEVVSAFGTVGLSMGYKGGVTSFSGILTDYSKILLIVTMLFGRIGPLVFLQSLPWRHPKANQPIMPDFENSDRIQIG